MEWKLSKLVSFNDVDTLIPLALIVLNAPLRITSTFEALWKRASVTLFADGGANRVYDALGDDELRKRYLPSTIVGDLDSLRPDVRDWYAQKKITAQEDHDQNSTDFQKCLAVIDTDPNVSSSACVVAVGALSGRFDHVMHAINVLHLSPANRPLYLLSDESVAFLLRPGKHTIICDTRMEGPTCGLLPIGAPVAHITSTGLKWNLDSSLPTKFGGLVSTSNAFADEPASKSERVVTVDTDGAVVWTCELRS
ncbi:thiamine diphosphokinase [Synchytrium endobioticum]|uniref:Thiamine pyrophosphokinase n=1 Tax=Synchytrium endobioticum TaxID=286115 RepID=A0A507CRE2_9FUNG|nr:thiamine diphosphokinase [Synchytrium endobioticum]TPX44340.1 thiamine diphosphokinase [Synchytrium endobioticum]